MELRQVRRYSLTHLLTHSLTYSLTQGSFLLSSNPTDAKVAAVIDGVKRENDKGIR